MTFEHACQYALAELGLVLQDLCRLQAFSMEACALTGRSVQKMMTLFACSTSLQSLSLAHNEGLGQDGIPIFNFKNNYYLLKILATVSVTGT